MTPLNGLDHAKLARLNVAGGNIRAIALNAAFIAAGSDQPVSMKHLLRAATRRIRQARTRAHRGGGRRMDVMRIHIDELVLEGFAPNAPELPAHVSEQVSAALVERGLHRTPRPT